jgi:hypothetical protein
MKRNVSVVRLIVATRSSGPPANGKIIKETPGSVASGTPYIIQYMTAVYVENYLNTYIQWVKCGALSVKTHDKFTVLLIKGYFSLL